jgi:translocation and assembly module TamB
MDLTVESVAVDLAPLALLARQLLVERAEIDGVLLTLFPATASAAAPPAIKRDPWQAPLAMRFDELLLRRGELRRPQAAPFRILRASLAGSWSGTSIEASKLALESPEGTINLAARIGPRAPKLQHLQAEFRWRAGEHQWAGTLGATGASETLELSAALDLPVKVRLASTIAPARTRGTGDPWRAHLTVERFDPQPLITTDAFDSMALELDADGDFEDLSLRGVLTLGENRVRLEQLVLARRQELLQISAIEARLNSQPAALTGSATLALDGSKPASMQLAWDEFQLPEAWAGAAFRCSGQIAATVGRERFAVNGSARLARAERYSTLALRFDGTKDSLHIAELELTQNPGAVSISGDMHLGAAVQWKLDAMARAFDPSLFVDSWPGALDFDLHSTGEWPEQGPRANFKLERLAGKLRGRPFSGTADVSLGRDLRPSGRANLKSGSASLEVIASAAPASRVDATLRVATLEDWHSELSGAISANVTSLGRWPNVEVRANAEANRVHHGGTAFETAKLTINARDARAPQGSIAFVANGVKFAGFQFDQTTIGLEGDERSHRLKLDARGDALAVALEASGALERHAAWSGLLEKLRLEVANVPPLALRQPARLAVGRTSMALDQACLDGGDIALCVAGKQSGQEFAANYSLRSLPISVLTALAAPESPVSIEGLLEGDGELRRTGDGTWSGQARLSSATGAFSQGNDKDALRIDYRDFALETNLSRETGQARLHGTLVDQGVLEGSLSIAVRESDPSLAGKASLELRDLAPLAWWVPQLAQMRGSGALSASVSGTVGDPRVAFTVQARDLDAEVPLLGLHLKEGNVSATLKPDGSLEASGSITSGDGTVRLTGTSDATSGVALKLAGSKFLAANIPGARVAIAPELTLAGKLGALTLTGSVTIEDADVNLEKISIGKSASASSDVVVVDREQRVKERAMGLTTDVRILFGENVKLAGYGLESTVAGELRVTEKPEEVSRASGEIRVAGTYEAFGRKLTIERGRLQYAGTALDDPQLDILAQRKMQDVTAKLRVTGTAQNPKLDVYTDPIMSQTDAMSYLLTGKPASDLHGEDGAEVQSAAQFVGSGLGNRLAKKFGGKVGFVDEVGVEQNTDLGGSAFTVGKYLSPRLFVSYGVGLFEPGTAITVRWQFSERWSLEANDTPEDQHAGVRYRIEK